MSKLYRKTALEKLSSPDRLDCMLTVSSPLTWVAVAAAVLICTAVILWSIFGSLPKVESGVGVLCDAYNTNSLYSDCGGTVSAVMVKPGTKVTSGTPVLKVKDISGSEQVIRSDQAGIVTGIYVEKGMEIGSLDEIIRLSPEAKSDLVAVCYVPISVAKQLETGMDASVYLSSASSDSNGYMLARVINVDSYIASTQSMCSVLGDDGQLAAQISQNGPVAAVTCELQSSNESVSGYRFSGKNGNDIQISCGEIVTVRLELSRSAPITRVFPMLEG